MRRVAERAGVVAGGPAGLEEIPGRIEQVRERVASAARRAGRDPGDITLIAVCKSVDVERVRCALQNGISDLGENRVQEAEEKIRALGGSMREIGAAGPPAGAAGQAPGAATAGSGVAGSGAAGPGGTCGAGPVWHMVGHLQSNKAARAARLFHWVHGVDSVALGERLDRAAADAGRTLDILLQVNLSGEPSKSGVGEAEAPEAARLLSALKAVRLRGLMVIPAPASDPEASRPGFRRLRALRDAINDTGATARPLEALSMGMTDDFEVAIEEGATHIRVGRAIFGER